MSELKPCPFCGGDAEVCEGGINGKMRVYGLVEHKDGCFFLADGLPTKYQHIMESDFAAWNTRTDDYRQAAEYWKRMYEEAFAERTCSNVDDAAECGYFKCSKCNAECSIEWCYSGYGVPSYCPNCGAKVVDE